MECYIRNLDCYVAGFKIPLHAVKSKQSTKERIRRIRLLARRPLANIYIILFYIKPKRDRKRMHSIELLL